MKKMNIILSIFLFIIGLYFFIDNITGTNIVSLAFRQYIVKDKLFNEATYLQSFVTPHEPAIKEMAQQLKGGTEKETVEKTYNWLEKNYHYRIDKQKIYNDNELIWYGMEDTWNLPVLSLAITKQNGFYGDCEDGTFLLVSLLRANGIDAYAVIGTVEIEGKVYGHAWVIWKYQGNTYLLETTRGAPFQLMTVPSIYHADWMFNESEIHPITGKSLDEITPEPKLPPEEVIDLKNILDNIYDAKSIS